MNKFVKSATISACLSGILLTCTVAHADSKVGDTIVTIGEDLSQKERKQILEEMSIEKETQILTISNEEEHHYLDSYIPKAQIGSKSLSSTRITNISPGSGVMVKAHHVTWVTESMFENALATAGVKDVDVYVTAPYDVSGTAALTGVMKAYETSTNTSIPEEKKQIANEEMVTTAQLADTLGPDKAQELMKRLKEEVAKQKPESEDEMEKIIRLTSEAMGISLPDPIVSSLVDLFLKMEKLDIDWGSVISQVMASGEKVGDIIQSDEANSFINSAKESLQSFWKLVTSLFNK
ncbi:DUF1002 domain-containing protein [Pseudobacillus sp. 179-B 2D1 NHS]|uniref:DUF1002 domain-containing protein n=1 Tax=Pseudobacillus sp. 179-B 2D1 NHS TaxID=3374292 RepID=UPI0038793201